MRRALVFFCLWLSLQQGTTKAEVDADHDSDFYILEMIKALPDVISEIDEAYYKNEFVEEELEVSDMPGEHLNPNDFRSADNVIQEDYDSDEAAYEKDNPLYSPNKFEGDIVDLSPDDFIRISDQFLNRSSPAGRNAIRDAWRKWPNGVVHYVISNAFSTYDRSIIAKAIKQFHAKTCIRFVPRTNEVAYIHIVKGAGCSSSVGRTGRAQYVTLGNGCVYTGIVIHELMHAVGFWHEQSRADRDNYVRINWHNIQRSLRHNFLKYTLNKISHLGVEYDTCSIMHYGPYSFSTNGRPTIERRSGDKNKCKLGQRNGFSETDTKKINLLYKCSSKGGKVSVKPTPKPTKPKPQLTCTNLHKFCDEWSTMGECKKNPSWMLKNCRKSCKECKSECSDSNADCKYWGSIGECDKNPGYMHVYCPMTCKICQSYGKKKCTNKNKYCSIWASKGHCNSNKKFMHLKCKKSCNRC